MNFWRQLVSGKDNVSSKRFAGLCLIASYMIHMSVVAIGGGVITEPFESLMKTTLYTGGVLLGAGLADGLFKNVTRTPVPTAVKEKEDDTESK